MDFTSVLFLCSGYSQAGINDKDEPDSYPLWIVSISGPFLFVTAVIHAALWKPWSSLFGAIVSLIQMHAHKAKSIILHNTSCKVINLYYNMQYRTLGKFRC